MNERKLYENPGWDSKKEKNNLQEKEQILRDKDNILAAFQARIITMGRKMEEDPSIKEDIQYLMDAAGRIARKYYSEDGQNFLNSQMNEAMLLTALKEIQQFNLLSEKYTND
jgi:hypothetical protein